MVLAGGTGSRVGAPVPKQFLPLGDRTILEHSVSAFLEHPGVDDVLVVMASGHVDRALALLAGLPRPTRVVEGGANRSDSTRAALAALDAGTDRVLLHDAARPLVSRRIIDDCLTALADHPAVNVAIPATDTIMEVSENGVLRSVPPRERMWQVQTPQCFHVPVIRAAYDLAARDPAFTATDDTSVVRRYLPDTPIQIVTGDPVNLKITNALDLRVAELLLTDPEVSQVRW